MTGGEAVAVGAGPRGASRRARLARGPVLPALAVVGAAVAVGARVRVWQIGDRISLGWNDSTDFVTASARPWGSLDLWAGRRPPAVPVLLKLVGADPDAYVVLQAIVAVGCWALLAASVSTVVGGRGVRWLAPAAVVAFSLTTPVTMWERSVLSESVAVSLLALVVAAALQLARRVTPGRVAVTLVALALWLGTRDSHVVVAVVGGVVLVAAAGVLRWRALARGSHDAPGLVRGLAALGAGALVLGLVAMAGSSHGERHAFPMRNVYEVRVLPYPDRVAWFADHGMPQADEFVGPDARQPYVDPAGGPPVVYVPDDDAELARWLTWVETDGRAAFARFVATHPLYLVSEPSRAPERSFNNAFGDRSFYRPLDMPEVPLVDGLLARRTPVVVGVGIAVAVWAAARGRRPSAALTVGAVLAVLAVPHGLVAWHSDGMETARHLVVPALQLHLGVLLMVVGLLPGPPAVPRRPPDVDLATIDDGVAGGDGDGEGDGGHHGDGAHHGDRDQNRVGDGGDRVIEQGAPGVPSPHG